MTKIVFWEVIDALELPREEAPANRRVGYDWYGKLRTGISDPVLQYMVFPKRDLDFDSGDFVDFDGSSDRVGANFTEGDATNLTLFDKFSKCIDSIFDWCLRIDSRALVKIKLFVSRKNLEAIIHCPPNSFRGAIRSSIGAQAAFYA